MSENRQQTGKYGEEHAAVFLKQKGYTVIEKNYRQPCGEIDIIARDGETLVFIEVKTRRTTSFGSPFEAITDRKKRQIARTAQDYLCRKKQTNKPARFDVIGIVLLKGQEPHIEIIKNAFDMPFK